MRIPAGLLLMLFCTASCGKKGALIYPEMVAPAAPVEVTARQTGSEVRLSFQLTKKDMAGRAVNGLAGINIFKQGNDTSQGGPCSACSAEYPLFKKIYVDQPDTAVQRFDSRFIMLDGQVSPGNDYAYFVQSFLQDGTTGSASLPVKLSVVPALEPPVLRAVSSPTEIRLEFSTRPYKQGIVEGFSIYRSIKGQPFSYLPYTKEPATSGLFIDFGLQRQVVYAYVAKSVVRMPNGALVESSASDIVDARLLED